MSVPDMCVMKDTVCMDTESTTVLKKEYGVETPAMYPHVKVYKEAAFLLKCVIIVRSGVS